MPLMSVFRAKKNCVERIEFTPCLSMSFNFRRLKFANDDTVRALSRGHTKRTDFLTRATHCASKTRHFLLSTSHPSYPPCTADISLCPRACSLRQTHNHPSLNLPTPARTFPSPETVWSLPYPTPSTANDPSPSRPALFRVLTILLSRECLCRAGGKTTARCYARRPSIPKSNYPHHKS